MEKTNEMPAFLSGGGEVGALMRTHDWSGSMFGPPDSWPHSLRTVVGLMLNSKFAMFLAWGDELRFLYNDSYAEILGDKHPSALGSRFQDIWAELWHDVSPLVERALAGESTYHQNLPLTMRRKGYGEQTWFTFSYSPVRDESGKIAGMFCAVTETTAQVLAEREHIKENERLHRLFEQAPGLMAVFRERRHIFELANTAYLQLIGQRDIIGKPVREALPETEGQDFFELLDHVYATGEPYIGRAMSVRLQRESGSTLEERFIDFIYRPIKDAYGRVTGIFVEGSDVTEAVHAEQELRLANQRKDEFLAMLAHELRNPLAPISTAAQLLKLTSLDEARMRQTSDIIARQVEHMTELVDDLLNVSRVTRGLVTLDKVALDLDGVVLDAVEQVRPLIEAKRHHLMVQAPTRAMLVEGDRTRLVQVFTNILNNAAKYTPEDGSIVLRLDMRDSQVEFSVRDNGIGIAPELLPYVFDLFTQAERSPDRTQGGLGLGLALVKSLVELHGGRVAAYSEGPGKGSEFIVRLPRFIGPVAQGEHQSGDVAIKNRGNALHVMIVDDNADAAQILATLLEETGHRVAVEYIAQAALERARREAPQVLILDIGLPDMDGHELARRLHAMPETAGAVLIALTGYGRPQDREHSKSAGFDHHLVKPASAAEIIGLLDHLAASKPMPRDAHLD